MVRSNDSVKKTSEKNVEVRVLLSGRQWRDNGYSQDGGRTPPIQLALDSCSIVAAEQNVAAAKPRASESAPATIRSRGLRLNVEPLG